jgi:hypothetical protein
LNQELELRNLIPKLRQAEREAGALSAQVRQFRLNLTVGVDPGTFLLAVAKGRNYAHSVEAHCKGLESSIDAASRGALSGRVSRDGPSAIPGLAGDLKGRATELTKFMRQITQQLDRLTHETYVLMNHPLRHAGAVDMMPGFNIWLDAFGNLVNFLSVFLGVNKPR